MESPPIANVFCYVFVTEVLVLPTEWEFCHGISALRWQWLCVCMLGSLRKAGSPLGISSAAPWDPAPCFSPSAVWCKHFSNFGWHSSFVLLVLHISPIQLHFFTANKLSNDLVLFSCCRVICNLMVFSVSVLGYNHSPGCLFEQLSTNGKPKSSQLPECNWCCVSDSRMDDFIFFKWQKLWWFLPHASYSVSACIQIQSLLPNF